MSTKSKTSKPVEPAESFLADWHDVIHRAGEEERAKHRQYLEELTDHDLVSMVQDEIQKVPETLMYRLRVPHKMQEALKERITRAFNFVQTGDPHYTK